MKNAGAMYANAVPSIVQRTKDQSDAEQSELSKGSQRGRGDRRAERWPAANRKSATRWRKIYANDFTEQELKDLVTFYKIAARAEAADAGAQGDSGEHGLHEPVGAAILPKSVNGEFRAEMRKRGKQI